MTEDIEKIGNTGKTFDLVFEDGIEEIKFYELTLKELAIVRDKFVSAIKEERRKDAMEFAENLEGEERIKYFVEVAKTTNKITEQDIGNVFDSVFGMVTVLELSADVKFMDWDTIFRANIDICMEIYLFALGLLGVSLDKKTDKKK